MSAKTVLSQALALLDDGRAHAAPPPFTSFFAIDEGGLKVRPTDPRAVAWTSVGAVHAVEPVRETEQWAATTEAGLTACALLNRAAWAQGYPNVTEAERAGWPQTYQLFHCASNLAEPAPRRAHGWGEDGRESKGCHRMTIRNTTRETLDNPLAFIVGAMGDDPSAPILAQEAQGQREVVSSTAIPTDMHSPREEFEALGFVLGEVHADDPMFRECTLPKGWAREGSDHAMWSYIIDERGFRRASIFYKAAFYDRSAHIGLVREPTTRAQDDSYEAFEAWCPYDGGWSTDTRKDGDNLVHRARLVRMENGRKAYDHDAGEWDFTGAVRERVVAPDGSTVEEREFKETSA